MDNTLNIEKGTVLYKRSDGSEIVFTKMDDEDFYGFVRNSKGKVFEEQLLGSILRRGDWEATYEPIVKHGDHDQSEHGAWATGQLSSEQKGAISSFTSLGDKSSWREIANDLADGKKPKGSEKDIETVKTLVNTIKTFSTEPPSAILSTGLKWKGALPKVGDTVKNEITSASTDSRISEKFATTNRAEGKSVIFTYGRGTKGLNVNKIGSNFLGDDEKEWLISGSFKVTNRYKEKDITYIRLQPVESVKKHGEHDQSTHGNRDGAGGGEVSPKAVKTIIERLSETKTPGVTIDLKTAQEPRTGYICSKKGFEKQVKLGDFDANKKKVIEDYIDKNMEELSKKGAFFGGWVVKSEDKVYLDVSRKFDTRQDAVRAMFDNEQDAIFDVKNDSYIYRKDEKDDRTNKAIYGGSSNTYKGYDERRERRFYRKNLESDRGESLNEDSEHVCLGRYGLSVKKHGDHDQSTHGSWAVGRFPKDSVPKARNGAKDYAYKKGIKQDDTIDYNKVVANRERASKIADIYETLPKLDRDAIDEYESLSTEVEEQFDFMTKELGIKVEFVKDDPYKTSKEMFDDASKGVLKVLSTESTGAHPLFSNAQNDKFRAVHDYFGHAATGRGFGQDGEEAAWVHHSQMFTEKARGALTTETRGQNSFFNNRGKQFADQKVALLPEEFWKVPVSFTKNYAVIYFDYGLKPVLKHEGHEDQSSHGNWATGRSEEDVKRISEFKNRGPSISLLDKSLEDTEPILDRRKAEFMIDNDRTLNEEVERRISALITEIEEQNGEPMSEEDKLENYDDYRNQVIEEYMDEEPNALENFSQREYGESIFEPKPIAELQESLNEVYGLERTATFREGDRQGESVTLTSSVDEVTVQGNTIKVVTNVRDDMGNVVNDEEIIRTFEKNEETGTWSVEHEFLRLNEEYRGLGFGSRFLQQSEDYYVAKGLTHITLNAGLEDGARHWANSGFDWNRDKLDFAVEQMDRFINETERRAKLDYFTDNNDNDITLSGEAKQNLLADLSTARALLSNMGTPESLKDMKNDNFPKPRDFASLGADRPITLEDGTKTYSGKILLAGKYLPYMKILTAEGQNLLSGPIDMDGDGMVYDGTPREKPVSSVGKD